jgi:hypothetical protein
MTTVNEQIELKNKIIKGLELVYIKLLAYKKEKNSFCCLLNSIP